jgi:3-phosphoglycerate kinase
MPRPKASAARSRLSPAGELDALVKALEHPARPLAAVVGGAKVSGKLDMLGNLLAKVDVLIIGGAMANTFLAARGKKTLARVKTLVWNGPFGAFEHEPFDNGTIDVAEAAAELTQGHMLVSVAGGGDKVAALNAAAVTDRFTYVSTAGGAFLECLEGKALPCVEALRIK